MPLLRTPFKFPLALFLISGLIGVWTSYNPSTSWNKFLLIVLATVLYIFAANTSGWMRTGLAWIALFLSSAFAIYFASQHNFSQDPGKIRIITDIGEELNRIAPNLNSHVPQSNIASGPLEIAFPLGIVLAWQRLGERRWLEFGLSLLFSFLIGFGVLMTSSRGAWLSLLLVLVGLAVILLTRKSLSMFRLSRRLVVPLLLDFLLVGIVLLLHFWDSGRLLDSVGVISAGDRSVSRLLVYNQASQLIQDYAFTGIGLGVFPMVFSTYALLIDVPFLTHAHNLFIEVWIEQGLLGIVGMASLVITFYYWVWRRRDQLNWIAVAGILATTVMLIHGLFDVLFYSSRFLPLMFAPMGIAVAGLRPRKGKRVGPILLQNRLVVSSGLVILVALLAMIAFSHDAITSAWLANLGSVEQTRTELSRYHFMDSLVEDVRRESDLSGPEDEFRDALALDGGNVTANQRLASILLARGKYSLGLNYAKAAEERDPLNNVTRELVAESYLGLGQLEESLAYWSGVTDAASQLERLAYDRYERNGNKQGAAWAMELARRLRAQSGE